MKKFIKWIKSPASDFALLVILLILANLVGRRAFLRIDLTKPKSYSLSEASKQLVGTLSAPLSVRAFFSDNLPAPYSNTAEYVRDMLAEYNGAANGNFSYSIVDMGNAENETLAAQYGLRQVPIQRLSNNELGITQVYMGLVVSYADAIETLDGITSSEGFEYRLTTTIGKMISTADTLAGLSADDKITLTLYLSDELKQFAISGIDTIEETVRSAYGNLNRQNAGRIDFEKVSPSALEARSLAAQYGVQVINWTTQNGGEGAGAIGLVLERGDTFRLVPISMQRALFSYVISGLDNLEQTLSDTLQSLLLRSTEIGYVTGHGEVALYSQGEMLGSLTQDMYTLSELNLAESEIPASVSSIIINAPKTAFTDAELYKIDQFLMRGGNVMLFLDPFDTSVPETQNPFAQQSPTYAPLDTNLNKLLNAYGIVMGQNYVFDEQCAMVQQGAELSSLWWAPSISQKQLARNNAITANLGRNFFFLLASSVETDIAESDAALRVTPLVKSSDESWLMENPAQITQYTQPPYDKSTEKAETLAALVEGRFKSAFAANPNAGEDGELTSQTHIAESVQSGKIFVAGTSEIAGARLIGEGTEQVALFVRNVIDYMNGNEELCLMRTKGISSATLQNANGALANVSQYFNEFGLAILVALFGLLMWRMRTKRRRRIHDAYNPDDKRVIGAASKGTTEAAHHG